LCLSGVIEIFEFLVKIVFISTSPFFRSLINSRDLYADIPPQIMSRILLFFKKRKTQNKIL
jgi:hypothetical protein